MAPKKRVNKYPRAFQLMAMERMKHCENVSELARELGIDRTVLYHWKNQQPDSKNLIRKLVRGLPVKRNSYEEFVRRLQIPTSAV